MRAEKLAFRDTALQTDRTFLDDRRRNVLSRSRSESAGGEFVGISAAFHAAEVGFLDHCGGSQVYDELAGLLYNIV